MCPVAGKSISVSLFITNVLVKICQPGIADRQTHDPNLHIITFLGVWFETRIYTFSGADDGLWGTILKLPIKPNLTSH